MATRKKVKKAKFSLMGRKAAFSRGNLILFALVFAAVGGLVIWRSKAASIYSIVLNQPSPHYGDNISFTGTYPKEAAQQYLQSRYPDNPDVAVYCWQNGVEVYLEYQSVDRKTQVRNKDGSLTGIAGPIPLTENRNGMYWPGGAATCSAVLWYVNKQGVSVIVAQTTFNVAA